MNDTRDFPIYRAAISGLLAMLVGLGVARFGYGPLVPALVGAQWYSATAAFWLGAVNLLGYFFGAALDARLARQRCRQSPWSWR